MPTKSALTCAITGILGGSLAGAVGAASPEAVDSASTEGLAEITVTAQRRTENMQDVPITIQAFTGDTIAQLNVATFDDFIKYVPNVTQASNGPGQSSIFMRGLSLPAQGGSQNLGVNGQFPNVAVYLDDQSVSLPGRNLDVYAADLERIEVLEGPQGTLFGSGAEAGVLRYITNKPKLDVTEGVANAVYSYTDHGDPNVSADATLNLPLIPGTLAVRAVIYNDSRGGYINNLPSSFTRLPTDVGFASMNGGIVPTDSVVINNNGTVGNAINPLTYQGLRFSVRYSFAKDWEALLAQSYQSMDAQGAFYQMPYGSEGTTFSPIGQAIGHDPLPPLSVTLFNPSYNKDKFENTALTIDGKVGPLKAVYSGSYLVRDVDQQNDYTNYARGVYASYYQCVGLSPTSAASGKCYSPSTVWQEHEKNTHQTHEVRLSTSDDGRIRGIAGLFYEQFVILDTTDFLYKTVPTCSASITTDCFNNIQPWPGSYASNPNVRNDNDAFLDDVKRTIVQKAAFGSVDVDLVPKVLTLSAGTRYYRFDESEVGGDVSSFGCKVSSPTTYFGPCLTPSGTDLNTQLPNTAKYTGFRSRATLSWKIDDDVLLYYTWSQGFRPGGFNQGVSGHLPTNPSDPTTNQFYTPAAYAPDSLVNNELGFKTLWFNRRLQLNGTIYQEDWKNAQVTFFDPQGGLGNIEFSTNGANYRVRGQELQIAAKLADGLTLTASTSHNDSKQVNSPYLVNNNPLSPDFGKPITSILNAYGPQGSLLANAPQWQWSLRLRDEVPLGSQRAFWQLGAQHTGNSVSATGNIPSFDQPGYTTYDASVGVAAERWSAELFGQNLTSVNASTGTNGGQFVETQTVIRPRIAGVKLGLKF